MPGPRAFLYVGMGAIGGTVFVATAYWTAISYAPAPNYTVSDVDRERTWEKIAPTYFNSIKGQEFYLGIRNMRKKLARECRGDVLEVGAGTGTMVGLYPPLEVKTDDEVMTSRVSEGKSHKKAEGTDLASQALDKVLVNQKLERETGTRSSSNNNNTENSGSNSSSGGGGAGVVVGVRQVVMGDRAFNMMKQLEEKIQNRLGFIPHTITEDEAHKWKSGTLNYDKKQNEEKNLIKTVFDAETCTLKTAENEKHPLYQVVNFSAEDIPFPDNSFDTVVDIFGLCSYDDPVRALMEMSRVCKPDGQILLLEHGKGTWQKINMQLDKWAPRHAKSWGCWWNRDHRRYLRLAGLKVVKREEKHFGTTQKLVVKPNKTWMPECKQLANIGFSKVENTDMSKVVKS